jgi:hypothetical protein
MYKNQKGLGVVEAIIVIAIVGIIAGTSWYVWRSKHRPQTKDSANIQQVGQPVMQDVAVIKTGYKLYGDNNLSLQYPNSWTVNKENDKPTWIYFKSKDYVAVTELGSTSVKAGYLLDVVVSKAESYESYGEDLKFAKGARKTHGGTYETIKIDGHEAVLSNSKSEGSFWYATTYYRDNKYYFRFSAPDEKKPGVKEQFQAILDTVKLK